MKKTPTTTLTNAVFNSKGVVMKKFNQKYSGKIVVMMGMLQKNGLEVNLENLKKILTLFSKYYRCLLPHSKEEIILMSQEELELPKKFKSQVKRQQYDNLKKILASSTQILFYVGYIFISYIRKILESDKSKFFKLSVVIGLILITLFILGYTLYFKVFDVNYLAEEYKDNISILNMLISMKEDEFDITYFMYSSADKSQLYLELLKKLFEKYPQLKDSIDVIDVIEEKIDISISPQSESDDSNDEEIEQEVSQVKNETNQETRQEVTLVDNETRQEVTQVNNETRQEVSQVDNETRQETRQEVTLVDNETRQETIQEVTQVDNETRQEVPLVYNETRQEVKPTKKEYNYKKVYNKRYNKKTKEM